MLKSAVRKRAVTNNGPRPSLQDVLTQLELAHAWPEFCTHKIETLELAARLEDVHLKELGLANIGDRLKLRETIALILQNEAGGRLERKMESVSKAAVDKLQTARRVVPLKKALLVRVGIAKSGCSAVKP